MRKLIKTEENMEAIALMLQVFLAEIHNNEKIDLKLPDEEAMDIFVFVICSFLELDNIEEEIEKYSNIVAKTRGYDLNGFMKRAVFYEKFRK